MLLYCITLSSSRENQRSAQEVAAAYRGKPLAAVSSSSRPFLEVLIGTGASEYRSLVEDPWWVQRSRSFFIFFDPPVLTFVSFLFLFRFFWACLCCFHPSTYLVVSVMFALELKAGGNPISYASSSLS